MPRLLAGNSLGVEAIWQHKAPSVWSRRIANLPLLTCRHGQIPAPDGSSSAQCFAQRSCHLCAGRGHLSRMTLTNPAMSEGSLTRGHATTVNLGLPSLTISSD